MRQKKSRWILIALIKSLILFIEKTKLFKYLYF